MRLRCGAPRLRLLLGAAAAAAVYGLSSARLALPAAGREDGEGEGGFWEAVAAYDDVPPRCSALAGLDRVRKYRTRARTARDLCAPLRPGGAAGLRCWLPPGKPAAPAGPGLPATVGQPAVRDFYCEGREWSAELPAGGLPAALAWSSPCRWTTPWPGRFANTARSPARDLNEFTAASAPPDPASCAVNLSTALLLQLAEPEGRNPWHVHEEVLTTFATLAALGEARLPVLINRRRPNSSSPLLEVHGRLFGTGGEALYAQDLVEAHPGGRVCLGRAIFPVPFAQSFHTRKPYPECGRSPILLAYRDLLLRTYGLGPGAAARNFSVLLLARRGETRRLGNEKALLRALEPWRPRLLVRAPRTV